MIASHLGDAGTGLHLSSYWSRFVPLSSPRLAVLLLLLGGSILLSLCSFPGSVPRTIKVGLSAPFEGLYRDLGYEALYAVRLAVQERNAAGGVGGRYLVELVALNDFNEPDEAARQAAEMAVDAGILAVLGGWSPATARAAGPEHQRLGLAFVAPASEPGRLGAEAARVAAQVLQESRAAVVYGSNPEDQELAAAFAAGFSAHGGLVIYEGPPSGDSWIEDLVWEHGAAPDLVFVAADAPTAAPWLTGLHQAGFDGHIMGGPAFDSRLIVDLAGEATEGVLHVSHLAPVSATENWVNGYTGLSGGAPPGPLAGWAYNATHRLLDGLEVATHASEGLNRPTVAQALESSGPEEPRVHVYVIRGGEVFGELSE